MKMEQIRQAIEVYNTGSINRAAQSLYLAQSSLSSSLKSLERELGRPIFLRSQSGITLTPFGLEFISHGREILKHMSAIEQYVAKDREESLSLNIAVYFMGFASRLFVQLCGRYAGESFSLHYTEDSRSAILQGVSEGEYEMGLLAIQDLKKNQWLEMMQSMGLEYTRITTESPYVLFGPRCELCRLGAPEVTLSQLKGLPFVTFPESLPLLAGIEDELFRRIRPGSLVTVSDRSTQINLLSQTGGFSIGVHRGRTPRQKENHPEIRHLIIRDAYFHLEIGYVKRHGQPLSFLAQEYLQSVKTQLLDDATLL